MSSSGWFVPPSEDVTVPTLPKVQVPPPKPVPDPKDVKEIEDQILRLAFGKAMKAIRFRTIVLVFISGMGAGFIALGVTLAVLLTKAGAS